MIIADFQGDLHTATCLQKQYGGGTNWQGGLGQSPENRKTGDNKYLLPETNIKKQILQTQKILQTQNIENITNTNIANTKNTNTNITNTNNTNTNRRRRGKQY